MLGQRPRKILDPEQERGEKIIQAMQKLERNRQRPRFSLAPWVLAFLLITAIIVILFLNRERFLLAWLHLTRPDSIPGLE